MSIASILHPERYHGFSATPPFFEGWYYKLVSADGETRFAIIPGIYLSTDSSKSHCFVQVYNSDTEQVHFHRFPPEAFSSSRDDFQIQIGSNTFSTDMISLNIDDEIGQISGELTFINQMPWPVRFLSPGAMGWFAWVPFMECYHGILSMDHLIQGQLNYEGKPLDFSGGRGYREKDWGKRFPSAWIWGQCNHFPDPGVSVTFSVAVIPWVGLSFTGFIIGFLHDGVLYRFTTYLNARIEDLIYDDKEIILVIRNKSHRLHIHALRSKGGVLHAPTLNEMDRRIIETINSSVEIRFETISGELIYEGVGQHAGLEVVGDLEKLLAITHR